MANCTLRCLGCGREYAEDGMRLTCSDSHGPSLLRSVYGQKAIVRRSDLPGIFQFSDWLPVGTSLDVKGAPITYQSERLARHLGLSHLFVSFNGYWPERGAFMETCTFKELEAPPTVARFLGNGRGKLVVASAGNTARAFAQVCCRTGTPLVLVVPESGMEHLWITEERNECVKLIVLTGGCDYTDSIQFANRLAEQEGFVQEGGALNVARRDGMATTVLDAVLTIGQIPDHYFQAVGSGTGAISAWEANLRLVDDGRYGSKKMRLHLSQNHPFTPIYDSWKMRSRELVALDVEEAKERLREADAKVLSNRRPPYSIAGGVYDALEDTNGEMYAVTNQELRKARDLFEELEGIDICPAASVAVASLAQAVAQRAVDKADVVLLNITGGGLRRLKGSRRGGRSWRRHWSRSDTTRLPTLAIRRCFLA